MSTKIVDNVSKNYSMAEIGHGSREIQFAYIDKKTKETVTPFCKCKDFFNDMFWSNKMKKDVSIYGFHWKPNQDKGVLDLSNKSLSVAARVVNKTKAITTAEAASVQTFLNQFEKSLNFKLSKVKMYEDGITVEYDPKWSERPYLNSAFLLFIRLGMTYDPSKDLVEQFKGAPLNKYVSTNDPGYFNSCKQRIADLLAGKIDTRDTYEKHTINTIHNNSGIVNYRDYKID